MTDASGQPSDHDSRTTSSFRRKTSARSSQGVAPDIAHAALQTDTDAFSSEIAERIRRGGHEPEYFDPERRADKTAEYAEWAATLARRAVDAVDRALSA